MSIILRDRAQVSRPHQVVTGVDKLDVTHHLRISDFKIFENFSRLKAEVQQGVKPSIAVNFGSKEYFKWNLQRTGIKNFPYVLRSGDITLMLSTRSHESPIANCRIEIGSVSSQEGAFTIHQKLLAWLNCYGFSVEKEIVSRVDLAADFINVKFEDHGFEDMWRWISRGRHFVPYSFDRRWTGIHLGSSRLMCRIYDKSLEVSRNKSKEIFFHDLWKCQKGTPVVRVEFQLRRIVLKEFEIPVNTTTELEQNLDSIWQYLTRDWARFTKKKVDRENKNHKQAENDPFWSKVQETVFKVISQKNWRSIRKNLHKNIQSLRDQVRGCVLNFAAAAGHDVNDFEGIIETCIEIVSEDLSTYMKNKYLEFVGLFRVRQNECYVGF